MREQAANKSQIILKRDELLSAYDYTTQTGILTLLPKQNNDKTPVFNVAYFAQKKHPLSYKDSPLTHL
jgi:hypothetical protein